MTKKTLGDIRELENKIASLPKGSITKKNIKNKTYYYHRYNQYGKRIEKYIAIEDVNELREKIDLRNNLERELKELNNQFSNTIKKNKGNYLCEIVTGEYLKEYALKVKDLTPRWQLKQIEDYLNDENEIKTLILYGLRRTGKTTLIRHAINNIDFSLIDKTALIHITQNNTMTELKEDLKKLRSNGFKYVFIDEVTLLEDFIEGSAFISDIFCMCGMKIILSGTDSLGFLFAKSDQLYDRCILIHTTFIPYKEFEEVLHLSGIDKYIEYGGTMCLSGTNYNKAFENSETISEYVDSAIAKNIQHSLKYYEDGGHFRGLNELYEANELTNVIQRVVEDINHRFTVDVLTKEFEEKDDRLDGAIIENLKNLIVNLNTDKLKEYHVSEIEQYLKLLDFLYEIDIRTAPQTSQSKRKIISMPGLRYNQAKELINSLVEDKIFDSVTALDKAYIVKRILNEIKGRMLEDIILLETKIKYPKKKVFKLQFAIEEYDMVVFDNENIECEVYEIKYSSIINEKQYRYLVDDEKLELTKFRYGTIKRRAVIYNGESLNVDGVEYINACEYLKFE